VSLTSQIEQKVHRALTGVSSETKREGLEGKGGQFKPSQKMGCLTQCCRGNQSRLKGKGVGGEGGGGKFYVWGKGGESKIEVGL